MGTGKRQHCFSWDRNGGPETRMQGTRYISAKLKTLFTKVMDFTGRGFVQPALVQLKRINLNHITSLLAAGKDCAYVQLPQIN